MPGKIAEHAQAYGDHQYDQRVADVQNIRHLSNTVLSVKRIA
jgi:hypothetical protein